MMKKGVWSPFREPDFARFCTFRVLSGVAVQMQNVAVGWFVYDLTHSAFALGMVGLAAFLPAIGLSLLTGQVADRHDRRTVILIAYGVICGCAAALAFCAHHPEGRLGLVYGLVVLGGAARAFANPCAQALLPTLIPRTLFSQAVALSSSAWQAATIVGPAAGGFLYVLGPTTVFATASVFFGLAALAVAALRHRQAPDRIVAARGWASVVAGIVFIRSRPQLLGAISLDLFAVLLGGATALLPIYAQTILGTGPWGLGILRSMPGLGAVAMSVTLATFPLTRHAGRKLFLAIGVFGLATIGFGLSTHLWLSMACLFVAGAADTISVVVRLTLVQSDTPDEMRGRVAAVNTVFIGASNELGEFESGLLAAWLGPVAAVVLGGLGTIGVALLWSRLFPALRDRDRLVEETPGR